MSQSFSNIFLFFLSTKLFLEFYLNLRNSSYIRKNRKKVPTRFEEHITLEEHEKAARYSLDKASFSRLSMMVDFGFLLYLTWAGGFQYWWDFVLPYTDNSHLQGILFFAAIGIIGYLISLPLKVYSIFVIEEKFGFNKMTARIFLIDEIKKSLLSVVIGFPLLYLLFVIYEQLGAYWWVYAWLFLSSIQILLILVYPNYIAPLFNKFTELSDNQLEEKVNELASRCDFQISNLKVMNASLRSSHGNAFFTGFGKNKRIVFFDTLLEQLSHSEVLAVLAHELGHFKKKHILKSMIKSFFISFISFYLLSLFIQSNKFFEIHFVRSTAFPMALMLFFTVLGAYTFFLTPIQSYFSQRNEYEADEYASTKTPARDLIHALIKLYKKNFSSLTMDPLYAKFYHSHPPAPTRIENLEKLATENS